MKRFRVVPLELKEANDLVASLHRHHKPVQGHRFSIGAIRESDGVLCGAAICGRPVARLTDKKKVLEITRLVTDGTKDACSFLYGAAKRIGRELGYQRVQTFILADEPGTSLIAAGYRQEGDLTAGGSWERESKPNRRHDQPETPKKRFVAECHGTGKSANGEAT